MLKTSQAAKNYFLGADSDIVSIVFLFEHFLTLSSTIQT